MGRALCEGEQLLYVEGRVAEDAALQALEVELHGTDEDAGPSELGH